MKLTVAIDSGSCCHHRHHHHQITITTVVTGMFFIDVLSVFPFFLLDLSPLLAGSGTLLRVPRLLRLAKLIKLARGGRAVADDLITTLALNITPRLASLSLSRVLSVTTPVLRASRVYRRWEKAITKTCSSSAGGGGV